jgi:hypothetical protein
MNVLSCVMQLTVSVNEKLKKKDIVEVATRVNID